MIEQVIADKDKYANFYSFLPSISCKLFLLVPLAVHKVCAYILPVQNLTGKGHLPHLFWRVESSLPRGGEVSVAKCIWEGRVPRFCIHELVHRGL